MAFGADRTVKVNLKATVSDYVGKMTAASKSTKDFSRDALKSAKDHRESWDKVGKGMVLTGAAIGAAVGFAVKSYADFDAQMSQVRAVSNASAGDMAKLTQAARDAGAGTKFSATEAATATTELAKVGISTSEILGGALTGSLSLAAAGNLDLAQAAEISGQTMKIFGLHGKDVTTIADALANGANKSAADVQTLSSALQQGGLVAAQTGLTMENTVGVLSLFADNALQGSDAGTSLKTMLMRLTPQTDAAAAAMEQIGLNAYDTQGNFVGIEAVAGQLQKGLAGLTQEQRNSTLQTIFGSDAVRAASILYKSGADGVREYDLAVRESGSAARVAAINQDNLRGDVEKLTGALQDLAIGAGENANGPLRSFVHSLTSMVDAVGDFPKPVQTAVFWTAALGSAALITGGSLLVLVPKIAATRAAMVELGISGGVATKAMKGLGAAAAVLAVAVVADQLMDVAAKASVAQPKVEDLAKSLGSLASGARDAGDFGTLFTKGWGPFAREADTATKAMDNFAESAQVALGKNFTDRIERFGSSGGMEKFSKQVDQIDAALASMVKNGNADQAAQAYDKLMASIQAANKEGAAIPVDEVAAKFGDYQAAIDGAKASQDAAAKSSDGMSSNLDAVKQSAEDAKKTLDDYVQGLQDAGLVVLSTRSANRDLQEAIDGVSASIKENGRSLDINTEKGRNNQGALDQVASSALDLADSVYKETGSEEKMRGSLVKSRASLIEAAQKFGMTKAEATKYADSILKIPAAKKTTATFTVVGMSQLQQAGSYLKGLHDKHVTLTVGTVKVGNTKVNAGQFADGGHITGPGTGTSDSIPAYLSNGEYVVKAAAVEKYGKSFFDQVNSMRFASGGYVSRSQAAGQPAAGATYAPTFTVQGVDAYQAAKKAMREFEYRVVSGL